MCLGSCSHGDVYLDNVGYKVYHDDVDNDNVGHNEVDQDDFEHK